MFLINVRYKTTKGCHNNLFPSIRLPVDLFLNLALKQNESA